MHRNYDFNYILKLKINIITRILKNTYISTQEEINEQRARDMWLSLYPYTVIVPYGYKKPIKFIPFSEFYKKLKMPKLVEKTKSMDEIVKRAEEIKGNDKKRNNA